MKISYSMLEQAEWFRDENEEEQFTWNILSCQDQNAVSIELSILKCTDLKKQIEDPRPLSVRLNLLSSVYRRRQLSD